MAFLFVASVAIISRDSARDTALLVETLGLPLEAPVTVPGSAYRFSEAIEGTKHFGVWPLSEVAETCFGSREWPSDRAVPQASIEFEVDDVEAAAQELQEAGYELVHPVRTEPWGQRLARFQNSDGLLLAVCATPHLREATEERTEGP